jgi:indolepyruvate ferredoxin oxidoreductase beta subunit
VITAELALNSAAQDTELAREIVECQRVLKGYGATYEHGGESFALLVQAAERLRGTGGAAAELARLRDAALADEDGTQLRRTLAETAPAAF